LSSNEARDLDEIFRNWIAGDFDAGGIEPGMGVARLYGSTMLQVVPPRNGTSSFAGKGHTGRLALLVLIGGSQHSVTTFDGWR